MRQRYQGNKVQNWHRPIHADALKQRYLRNRLLFDLDEHLPDESREYWNRFNPCHLNLDALNQEYHAGETEDLLFRIVYEATLQVYGKETPSNSLNIPREWATAIKSDLPINEGDADEEFGNRNPEHASGQQSGRLADRIYEFLQLASRPADNRDKLCQMIADSIGTPEDLQTLSGRLLLSEPKPDEYYYDGEIDFRWKDSRFIVLLFSPFWVRRPSSWNGRGGYIGLIEHLFCLYSAPVFLRGSMIVVADQSPLQNLKWMTWFIQIASGGSLRELGKRFGWTIPNRLQHFLYQTPSEFCTQPIVDLLTAETLRLGGDLDLAGAFCQSHQIQLDFTEPMESTGFLSFLESTVRWAIINRDSIVLGWRMREIVEWGFAMFCRQAEGDRGRFSWSGRTWDDVNRRVDEYHQEIYDRRIRQGLEWQARGWNWSFSPSNGEHWEIRELLSSTELCDEGTAMRHCVASYDSNCFCGQSAIFSVRLNGRRKLTVEVYVPTKSVSQVRGLANREPTQTETKFMQLWFSEVLMKKR